MIVGILFLSWLAAFSGTPAASRSNGVQSGSHEPSYAAATIPPELVGGADGVVRLEELFLEVESDEIAEFRVRRIVTILTPEGRASGELAIPYDRFRSVEALDGAIYNAEGTRVRTLESEDVVDYAATSGYTLYDESRVRGARMYHGELPYTVEFNYTIRFDGYLGWPRWDPEEEKLAIECSRFIVRLPSGMELRYWDRNSAAPQIASRARSTEYRWEARLLAVSDPEPLSDPTVDRKFLVHPAPGKFRIDGRSGDLSTWESFGAWVAALAEGKQNLPSGAAAEAAAILKGSSTRRDTIRALYEYLQSNMRYVSVQLGIGGWQPYDAAYVHDRKYGDCKALTNYMRALLQSVNIPSYYTLIQNDRIALNEMKDFPSQLFNHVILCVPADGDTIWLECTSRDAPFDHLGASNEGRFALLISENGGRLVVTPSSPPEQNRTIRTVTATLNFQGDAVIDAHTRFSGAPLDRVREEVLNAPSVSRDAWLRTNLDIPAFSVRGADYSGILSRSPEGSLRFGLGLPKYASQTANRIIVNPNILGRRKYVPDPVVNRRYPVRFSHRHSDVDSVRISIPAGFTIESLPRAVAFQADFARFSSETVLQGDSALLYTRSYELSVTQLPPERHTEYRDFIGRVAMVDKGVISLVRRRQ